MTTFLLGFVAGVVAMVVWAMWPTPDDVPFLVGTKGRLGKAGEL